MRILALPAALALAFCLYLPLPQSAQLISHALLRLYHLALRPFSRRDGRADAAPALAAMLLVLGGAVTVGVILALRQRLREIEGGEEDDAAQY